MMTTKRVSIVPLASLVTTVILLLNLTVAHADLVELVNGDHYSGNVIQLTRTNLEFQSEVQGVIKIPRYKVARIILQEPTPKPTNAGATNSPPATNSAASAEAVIQQMRAQGVDPNMMNQIQQQILGQSNPEATRMFNSMISGLMSGSLNVQDIRGQARKAIDDIQAARKDLDGDAATGELLDGYMGILQKFVAETEPSSPGANAQGTPPKVNPPAPAVR